MELILVIIFSFAGMIGVIFVYQYVAEKMGLNIKPQQQQPAPPPTPYGIYAEYKIFYEEMAHCLRDCLASVGRLCFLDCPRDVQKLYAAQVADRVKIVNGTVMFSYETARTGVQTSLNKAPVYSTSCAQISGILKTNLPAYLTPGLGFSDIHVFDIGNDYVRIVIENVNKIVNCNTCYTGGNYGGCAWNGGDDYYGYY